MNFCGKSQKTTDARRLIARLKDGERLSTRDMDLVDKFRAKERLRQKKLREYKKLTAGPPKKRGRRPRSSTSSVAKPKAVGHGPTIDEAKHNSVTQHNQEGINCQIGFSVNFLESSYMNPTDSWSLGPPEEDYQQDSYARLRCDGAHLTTLFDSTSAVPPIGISLHDCTPTRPSIDHWRMSPDNPTLSYLYRMAATGAFSTPLPPLMYSVSSPSSTTLSFQEPTAVTPVREDPPELYQNGPLLVSSLVFGTNGKCASREPMSQGAIDVEQITADIFTDHLYY
ncbi:hypothetical protein V1517DRAFT_327568 [Lipomyces orientalis]|uniref:Uncharacterized protein n=1 Tax=Lipomyces orientalis TaxID=1233043 RepID=A0ACC3TJS8_9ASCO